MTTIPRLTENWIRIRNMDENAPFRAWLAAELKTELRNLVASDNDRMLHQAQGAVRKLEHITDLIEGSPRALEKSRA